MKNKFISSILYLVYIFCFFVKHDTDQLSWFDLKKDLLDGFSIRTPLKINVLDVGIDVQSDSGCHTLRGHLRQIWRKKILLYWCKQVLVIHLQKWCKKNKRPTGLNGHLSIRDSTDFLSEGLIFAYQHPHHRISKNQRLHRKTALYSKTCL